MKIPFVKAEGAGNDFLISRADEVPVERRSAIAQAICHRQRGVGADGWYLVETPEPSSAYDAIIHLYNSDGSRAELSGNGTRCVAAWLASQQPGKTSFQILTGAGVRRLQVQEVLPDSWLLGMHMGKPDVFPEEELTIPGEEPRAVVGNRVDVGNPQFAVAVDSVAFDWKPLGQQLEAHAAFPFRSNISFYCASGENRIAARFYERGAGATLSSGTGATGAIAAAIAKGLVQLPAVVETEGEDFHFQADDDGLVLSASARLLAEGQFFWSAGSLDEAE